MNYSARKALNADTRNCVRSGCHRECLDDCLLCEVCQYDHRERNARSMRRTRMWLRRQLWLIE